MCLTLVYVDDLLTATKDVEQTRDLFKLLDEQYGIKNHGRASQYLGERYRIKNYGRSSQYYGVEIDQNDAKFMLQQPRIYVKCSSGLYSWKHAK